jgi:hypothetical protein
MSKILSVRPSDAILNALNELAAKENRSVNYLVNEALRQYLKIDANKPIEQTKQDKPEQTIPTKQTALKTAENKPMPKWKLNALAKQATNELASDLHDIDTSELNESEAF